MMEVVPVCANRKNTEMNRVLHLIQDERQPPAEKNEMRDSNKSSRCQLRICMTTSSNEATRRRVPESPRTLCDVFPSAQCV